jgi:hypothetical protein
MHHLNVLSFHVCPMICGCSREDKRKREALGVRRHFWNLEPSSCKDNCFATPANWTIAPPISGTRAGRIHGARPSPAASRPLCCLLVWICDFHAQAQLDLLLDLLDLDFERELDLPLGSILVLDLKGDGLKLDCLDLVRFEAPNPELSEPDPSLLGSRSLSGGCLLPEARRAPIPCLQDLLLPLFSSSLLEEGCPTMGSLVCPFFEWSLSMMSWALLSRSSSEDGASFRETSVARRFLIAQRDAGGIW